MSAGETAEEVLDRYQLLIHTGGYAAHVDEDKLAFYRKSIIPHENITP
jgi:hypothetical protein